MIFMPNEMKAAREVLDYALVNFGWDEEHHCAQVIADHTRHEGKTAQQWADECRSYQRNLADAQADIAGEVAHSQELATRVKELEALASRLKEQRDTTGCLDRLVRRLSRFAWEEMLWDVGRVEWKYGRTDDGKPKNWDEWNNVRAHLREAGKLRQPETVKQEVML
jgi:hypothetical protein